jgi:hypothetical protein
MHNTKVFYFDVVLDWVMNAKVDPRRLSERLLAAAHNNADRVFGKWPFTGKQLGRAAIRIGNRMLIWRNTMLLRSLTFIGEDGSLTVSGVG